MFCIAVILEGKEKVADTKELQAKSQDSITTHVTGNTNEESESR